MYARIQKFPRMADIRGKKYIDKFAATMAAGKI